jgi:hypothetical protein
MPALLRGGATGARLCRAGAAACALAATVPWLTLLSVAAGAAGVALFDSRARAALQRAHDAARILATGDGGLNEVVAVARRCVTAATVVRAASRARLPAAALRWRH